jgi:hypothetical protein
MDNKDNGFDPTKTFRQQNSGSDFDYQGENLLIYF